MSELGRRLVVGLAGPELHSAETEWLRAYRPAGVILFGRNCTGPEQCARLCADLRACLDDDAEIMADHEGGPISVLSAAVGRPPAAWTLGALGDLDLTRRVHRETARRLRDLGVDRVLAPCCDVLVEPRNPVIGARAFGADEGAVAAQVAAAVTGLREGGVRTCLKHFPGHGGTRGDSHHAAVVAGEGALDAPFTAGFAAGADGLMVGHIVVAGGSPLTLDRAALARIRADLPASTHLFADDVTMGGLRPALAAVGIRAADGLEAGLVDPASLTTAWLQSLADAGCDLLLVRGIPWGALPLTDGAVGPGLPAAVAFSAGDEPMAPVYQEARARAAAGIRLEDRTGTLLWYDATVGDRWGATAELAPWLAGRFDRVVRVVAGGPAPADGAENLLVTSHRPLTAEAIGSLSAWMAATGEAVAAGHPSLAASLRGILGPGWKVEAVFDARLADLQAGGPKGAASI